MITAICKFINCPYNMNRGWCSNPLLSIDENGMCGSVWKRGMRVNPPEPGSRASIIIEEGEYRKYECDRDSDAEGSTGDQGNVEGMYGCDRSGECDRDEEYHGENAGGD